MTQYAKDLANRLGFAAGDTVFVETTPDWYSDFADANGLELEAGLPATHAHIFCEHEAELHDFLEYNNLADIEKGLWVSWPRPDNGKPTDLDKDMVREALLSLNWVDTSETAVDDKWLGLQFTRLKQGPETTAEAPQTTPED